MIKELPSFDVGSTFAAVAKRFSDFDASWRPLAPFFHKSQTEGVSRSKKNSFIAGKVK